MEKWLFEHLAEELERCQLEWEVAAAKKKASVARTDKAALKRKLTKLKELYVNDLIDIEDYKRDYQIYTAALKQIPEPSIEHYPKTTPVIFWSLSILISLMTERQSVRFSSRVKFS